MLPPDSTQYLHDKMMRLHEEMIRSYKEMRKKQDCALMPPPSTCRFLRKKLRYYSQKLRRLERVKKKLKKKVNVAIKDAVRFEKTLREKHKDTEEMKRLRVRYTCVDTLRIRPSSFHILLHVGSSSHVSCL